MGEKGNKPDLTVIRGGSGEPAQHPVVLVGLEGTPPRSLCARVVEEDTHLVLSASPEIRDPKESKERIMIRAMNARPEPPGSVLVRTGPPLQMLAVVRDLNCDPTWKEEWVEQALKTVFDLAERLKIRSLGIPLLGTRYGGMSVERFFDLLFHILDRQQRESVYPARVWLLVSESEVTLASTRIDQWRNC